MKRITVMIFILLLPAALLLGSTDVKITYVNNSTNTEKHTIFVFTKNQAPDFDVSKYLVAWKIMPHITKGSSYDFIYPIESAIRVSGSDGSISNSLPVRAGKTYTVKNEGGHLSLMVAGKASEPGAIEVSNGAQGPGNVTIQITKDGKTLLSKPILPSGKTLFKLEHKLYWGVALDIQEGQVIGTAKLLRDHFFEHDVTGVKHAIVTLTGNPEEGYTFKVEHKR